MKNTITAALAALNCILFAAAAFGAPAPPAAPGHFFGAQNKNIHYFGRIDFSDPQKPRIWPAGAYIQARFEGTFCDFLIDDQMEYGHNHNYLEVVVDDLPPQRIELMQAQNLVHAASGLSDGPHTITICKDTESAIGYVDFIGFQCDALLPPGPEPAHEIEFIGDSITAGSACDTSVVPCGKGQWFDQDNTYMSYGPDTARLLDAQWHVTAVSGIGLIHSCCNMTITMPQVFGYMDERDKIGRWDFSRYQPDVVTVCLGQNDGEQPAKPFDAAYVRFIQTLRKDYPMAVIVCLDSPMADPNLKAYLDENIKEVVAQANAAGDDKVHAYFFSKSYNGGCIGHPDVAQHQLIAGELAAYLKILLNW